MDFSKSLTANITFPTFLIFTNNMGESCLNQLPLKF
jgi:hypothetical protein